MEKLQSYYIYNQLFKYLLIKFQFIVFGVFESKEGKLPYYLIDFICII